MRFGCMYNCNFLCVLEDGSSWDVVNEDDLWDDESMVQSEEDYVLVKEEDIAEGIACFMATYLSSLKQTKVLKSSACYFLRSFLYHVSFIRVAIIVAGFDS